MNELQVFKNNQFGQVRALEKDGQPWFVGKEVAEVLKYKEPHKAIARHIDEEDRIKHPILTNGGMQEAWLINESGLYSLILSSELPAAKDFKKWVTSEVLPSIRKHGAYMTDNTIEKALSDPDFLIKLATNLKVERAARIEAENKVQALTPKAQFYDDVAGSKDAIEMSEVAKVLGMPGLGRNKLFQVLRDSKVLQKDNIPYQSYVDRGYFRVLEQKYNTPKGETKINIKTLVFQKGVDYIRKIVKEGEATA